MRDNQPLPHRQARLQSHTTRNLVVHATIVWKYCICIMMTLRWWQIRQFPNTPKMHKNHTDILCTYIYIYICISIYYLSIYQNTFCMEVKCNFNHIQYHSEYYYGLCTFVWLLCRLLEFIEEIKTMVDIYDRNMLGFEQRIAIMVFVNRNWCCVLFFFSTLLLLGSTRVTNQKKL